MYKYHRFSPITYGRRFEQAIRRWRKRLPFHFHQWRIARAYSDFNAAAALDVCPNRPLYSIVVPVYRTDLRWLKRCIQSVRHQLYPNWELILVDDGSAMPAITDELMRWSRRDFRIRVFTLDKNQGIAGATNHALAAARGQFVGFLDHDDELTPDALLWMAVMHNRHPNSRWFYSDEAILEPDGNYAGRFHRKPAYSAEYLLSVMYTCHFTVYERELVQAVGGLRTDVDGAQDHDLALRVSERVSPDEVTHIPQILYFWRAIPESTASSIDAKPKAITAAYRAVSSAVTRRRLPCQVVADRDIPTLFHMRFERHSEPKVSIVIPTRNACSMVRRCIESIKQRTRYPNYEVVVIDNQSDEPELARYLSDLPNHMPARIFKYDRPFNHSAMHNAVVPRLDSDLFVLANNDVYDFSAGWLEQLVATLQTDDSIAGVGGKLLYPDGTIQHAGVVIGVADGLAGNIGTGAPGDTLGYLGRARSLQQMSAITGALSILRKSAYMAVGGFDAERYPTSYNDVDLWIRLGEAGYRCLYHPDVQAYHEESKTRGVSERELEYQRRLREDIKRREYRDPFWNLDLFDNPSRVARGERTATWALNKLEALQREVDRLTGKIAEPTIVPPSRVIEDSELLAVEVRPLSTTAPRDHSVAVHGVAVHDVEAA